VRPYGRPSGGLAIASQWRATSATGGDLPAFLGLRAILFGGVLGGFWVVLGLFFVVLHIEFLNLERI